MSADAAEPMAVSSSSGDSSDSDFEEVDATPEEMDLLAQLETSLEANTNLYDSHVHVGPCMLALAENSLPSHTAFSETFLCCST